jgi:hypothetical protein
MWTIQELALCDLGAAEVYCGKATIRWNTLYMANDILRTIEYTWGNWHGVMSLLAYLVQMMIRHRIAGAREIMDAIPGLDLEMLASLVLVFCSSKLSSDPKDKVFALYGLLNFLNVPVPSPDYAKSVATVYTEATAAAIEHDKAVFVICYVPSSHRRPGLPCWVPDWSDAAWDEQDPRYPVTRGRFKATSDAPALWRFTDNPQELVVYGRVIDTIVDRADSWKAPVPMSWSVVDGRVPLTEEIKAWQAVFLVLKQWTELAASGSKRYPTGEKADDAFRRTIVSDAQGASSLFSTMTYAGWRALMALDDEGMISEGFMAMLNAGLITPPDLSLRKGLRNLARAAIGRKPPLEGPGTEWRQEAKRNVPAEARPMLAMCDSIAKSFHEQVVQFSAGRAFFRTKEGSFGTAPDGFPGAVQSGDVIALIRGLAMPAVLRITQDGIRFVSTCYVHGMMHGELWPIVKDNVKEMKLV